MSPTILLNPPFFSDLSIFRNLIANRFTKLENFLFLRQSLFQFIQGGKFKVIFEKGKKLCANLQTPMDLPRYLGQCFLCFLFLASSNTVFEGLHFREFSQCLALPFLYHLFGQNLSILPDDVLLRRHHRTDMKRMEVIAQMWFRKR